MQGTTYQSIGGPPVYINPLDYYYLTHLIDELRSVIAMPIGRYYNRFLLNSFVRKQHNSVGSGWLLWN